MANFLTLKLESEVEPVALLLDVPLEYSAAQLIYEVIDACELNYVDGGGFSLAYYLQRESSDEMLSPHLPLGQSGLVRGETLYLDRTDRTVRLDPARLTQMLPHLPDYWPTVRKLQASGQLEAALEILLGRWQALNKKRGSLTLASLNKQQSTLPAAPTEAEQESEQLTQEIMALFELLIRAQFEATCFELFDQLLGSDAAKNFFEVNNKSGQVLGQALKQGSYGLGKLERYQNARDFAALARQLDPHDSAATSLENLAERYIIFQTSHDPQERSSLANEIYQLDPTYGQIARDRANITTAAPPTLALVAINQDGPRALTPTTDPPALTEAEPSQAVAQGMIMTRPKWWRSPRLAVWMAWLLIGLAIGGGLAWFYLSNLSF